MFKGTVFKFGDDINTDEIIPARYLNTSDEKELAKHVMEDAREDFVKTAKKGDIIVAGKNFGCGSSREHAPAAIKEFGVSCVIAKSFARIFYRNCINIGLPILEVEDLPDEVKEGDKLEVDLKNGEIKTAKGKVYKSAPFPEFMTKLIRSGGLINYVKKQLASGK